jgi:hypothetical protein
MPTSRNHQPNQYRFSRGSSVASLILFDKNSVPFAYTIDTADMDKVSAHQWAIMKRKNGQHYAFRKQGNKTIYLHRHITDAPTGSHVDHRDRSVFNMTRSNLRITDRAGNNQNRGKQRNNKSGYSGVFWSKKASRFIATIGVNGKLKYLGSYTDGMKAAIARDLAALELHGEFAVLNFPELASTWNTQLAVAA